MDKNDSHLNKLEDAVNTKLLNSFNLILTLSLNFVKPHEINLRPIIIIGNEQFHISRGARLPAPERSDGGQADP